MRRFALLLAMLIALVSLPAHAVQPDEIMADPALEARARTLSAELRCLVCQNQSIDDSAAPLARDLRLLVRERLKAGDSDDGVKAYLVARYGDFVLLKPPFTLATLLLWLAAPALLAAGAVAIVLNRHRGRDRAEAPPLDTDEQARLEALTQEPR